MQIRRDTIRIFGIVCLTAFVTALTFQTMARSASTKSQQAIRGGVLRHVPRHSWALIQDRNHLPAGMHSPHCNARTGILSVQYPLGNHIVTAWSNPDEYFVQQGYTVGVSVARSHLALKFARVTPHGTVPVSCHERHLAQGSGNFWIGVV